METVGVLLGLAAATAQSVSYILSRLYVIRRAGAFSHLLVLGHIIMGAMSVVALPFLPLGDLPPVKSFLWPLIGAAVFYLLGQAGMFIVLRHQEASRISPLLGLKIAILACITVLFLDKTGEGLSRWQWAAVALSVAAALVLKTSGKRMSWTTMVGIVLTCVAYSLSDIHIRLLTDALQASGSGLGAVQAVLTGVALATCSAG
jgi:drug/metabolite transporter (DMT)-like permease